MCHFKEVANEFLGCFKSVSRKFQAYFKKVSMLLEGGLMGVLRDFFEGGYKCILWMFKDNFRDISKVFQLELKCVFEGSFKGVLRKIKECFQ